MADAKRQFVGFRNKRNGAMWEDWITNAIKNLYREFASIEKTPEPFHMTGRVAGRGKQTGEVKGYYEAKAQPDFKGVLRGGRCIFFEAKNTDTDKIKQNCGTETQFKAMNRYQELGGLCYVMVSMGLINFYRVPWEVWQNMKELFGHKHMTEKDLAPYKLQQRGCFIKILDGIEIDVDED